MLLISLCENVINKLYFNYPGNNYFSNSWLGIPIFLLLNYIGMYLLLGRNSPWLNLNKEANYLFIVISLIAIASNSVQYTPFKTIDRDILLLEEKLHINMAAILTFTNSHLTLKHYLIFSYDFLVYQMLGAPIILIFKRQVHRLAEFYSLLLISSIIGFTFYYFFPTTAPASMVASSFFTQSEYATGLKFHQIHQHIFPTTIDGGLISMPSFHVIWAWISLFALRNYKITFVFLFIVNLFLVASCVLLGWHYVLDIAGSMLVLIISHGLLRQHKLKLKNAPEITAASSV